VSTYVFSPEWARERDRLLALEELFDDASARHLAGLGVGEGWRCLEVGCGAGGIARDNVEVRRHDILTDPLEEGAFDVAHARAVIEHVADHRGALRRVVAALRPGGWAVIEDSHFGGPMAAALGCYVHPAEHGPLVGHLYRAVDTLFSAAGADASFGPRLLGELEAVGLEGVGGVVHAPLVAGGTDNWARGSLEQLGPRLVAAGLATTDDVDRFMAMADDRASSYAPPFMVTAWGRRPMA